MLALPLLLLTSYAGWCALAYALQDRILFPGGLVGPEADVSDPHIDSIWITAEDGSKVEAWIVPGRGRTRSNPGSAVIHFHGNGELIDFWPSMLTPYRDWGISVLLVEYRGYGRSEGRPSQAAIVADAVQFYDALAKREGVDPSRIIFHGRSLGGGVAAALAQKRQAAALILESTFTSVAGFFRRFGVPTFLCRHPFRTDEAVTKFRGPILIFHGSHDEVVPVSHGRRLHELAPHSHYVEMDAGHNDFPPDPGRYWEEIRAFLSRNRIL